MVATYLRLTDYNGKVLLTTGQFDNSQPVTNSIDGNSTQFIQIESFSTNVEQTLNIGSQSTGAGAGKVTFNPMMITKPADATSPILFQMAASGVPFKTAEVYFVNSAGMIVMKYLYKLVAVKTVAWTAVNDSPSVAEAVSFEYGGLMVSASIQAPDGKVTPGTQTGWNRVKNVADNDPALIIK